MKTHYNYIAITITILSLILAPPVQAGFWDKVKEQADKARGAIESLDDAASETGRRLGLGNQNEEQNEQEHQEQAETPPAQQPTRQAAPSQPARPAAPRYDRAQVLAIQRKLNALGYDVGTPDGIYGPGTRGGIKAFQRDRGLPVDGKPSANLQAKLDSTANSLLTNNSRLNNAAMGTETRHRNQNGATRSVSTESDTAKAVYVGMDILGLKTGMDDSDVMSILKESGYVTHINGALDPRTGKRKQQDNIQESELSVVVAPPNDRRTIPDSKSIQYRQAYSEDYGSKRGKRVGESLRLTYSVAPNPSRVLSIHRTINYEKNKGPDTQGFLSALKEKYGEPSHEINRHNQQYLLIWAFDMNGKQFFRNQDRMRQYTSLEQNIARNGFIECGNRQGNPIAGILPHQIPKAKFQEKYSNCSELLMIEVYGTPMYGLMSVDMLLENHSAIRMSLKRTKKYMEDAKSQFMADQREQTKNRGGIPSL